ncbi:hypothetical protein EUTSA_v10008936mg [Eutrema salsugineum]|uniref:Uncharacterized protein n=1 Tax=Eutrema salsugineum TaxID=72664 RepID=V4KC45_EUTSA|nr:uncharacterized protein LOC18993349 [Eutrema salsugineum]ESQ35285.1 hypothetical protein EUTSA_v10008936mg [Eutrema salsugineum]
MEAAKERVGLLDKILPPALADAGLEDCALPPDSIQEAFRKAADAVKSRAASLFEDEEEGGCVADPRPASKGTETIPRPGASDTVIVGGGNEGDAGPCLVGKGNEKLAGSEQSGDALVVAGEGGEGKSCGDGLKDLDVEGMESSTEKKDQSEEDEEEEKKPILVEGYV